MELVPRSKETQSKKMSVRFSSEVTVECPHCKKRFAIEWAVGVVNTPSFCPFCGKEMEEVYKEVERQVDD
jgi:hypothetical protein